MKKTFIAFIAVLLAAFSAFTFGGKAPVSVTGYLKFYGNEPFVYPGIETTDGLLYGIEIEDGAGFSKADIKEMHGHLIKLSGHIEKNDRGLNSLKDGVFVASEYKIIE